MYQPVYGEVKCACKRVLKREVLKSAAGHYIGRFCENCGPYSRESGYFMTELAAKKELDVLNALEILNAHTK